MSLRGTHRSKSFRGKKKSRSLSPTNRNKSETRGRDFSFFKADWRIISIYASSHDPRHPPTAVVEKNDSFWSSTGLYPQQFHITLSLPLRITELIIESTGIENLSIQGRATRNANYRQVATKKFKRFPAQQKMTVSLEDAGPIEQLRLVILTGLDIFCSIKHIVMNGQAGRKLMQRFPEVEMNRNQPKRKPEPAPAPKKVKKQIPKQTPKKKGIDVGSIKGNIQQRSPAAPVITKPVFSTYVCESDIVMQPIGNLWDIVSTMDFSWWMENVRSSKLTDGPSLTTTGSLITIKYKDGSDWTVRLVAINEEKHYLTWELVTSNTNLGYTSRIDTFEMRRCTKENWTYVEWRTDFSSDATLDVIEDARHKRLEAFDHLETAALEAQDEDDE